MQNLKDQLLLTQQLVETKTNKILDLQSQLKKALDAHKDYKLDIESL